MLVVVAAVGVGGWFLYDGSRTRADSRARITEACQGLVDPDRVMRLARSADEVDAGERGDHLCVLRRAGTFEGRKDMQEYFSLTLTGSHGAVTGEGRFDYAGGRSVAVTAKCAEPVEGTGVTSFRATATSEFERTDFADPGELAALAREAALRAAAKAGCTTDLPEVPKDLTAAGR
ncbi:hypothetical protein ACFWCB_21955 [Streptomyces sp. NPDC060048]|uniref:hypothetical protein n=1 Tax=Streptomyces sp. NPDC060048 TaxID=3347045 RepID=UPI0036C9DA5B